MKTVEALDKNHPALIRSVLKAAGLRVGMGVIFDKALADVRRVELSV